MHQPLVVAKQSPIGYVPMKPQPAAAMFLQQVPKIVDCQAGILNYPAHRERLDWIMPRDRDLAYAVTHHDVLALADDLKTRALPTLARPPGG